MSRSPGIRGSVSVLVGCVALAAGVFAGSASAGSDENAIISPIGMSIDNAPNPVRGTDNRFHLAYEIQMVNQSNLAVTFESVRARSAGKKIGAKLVGPDLNGLLRVNGDGSSGSVIPAGGSALLFMDVVYKRKQDTPKRLTHTFEMTGTNGSGTQEFKFGGVPTAVGQDPAIRVDPPLKGKRWVVANGCCDPINAHRGATLAINGTIEAPERFAIDFVQVQRDGLLFDGPLDENESYPYFGDKIYSATDGKVVRTQDGLPEQTPGSLDPNATVQTAGGNYVVVRADRGHYAFYAHMQPGSLKVKKGDTVKAGQVLGKLGNTGNTDGAHLHFHIMDGPSPLQSNGLPFVYTKFNGAGHGTNVAQIQGGAPLEIDSSTESGPVHEPDAARRSGRQLPGREGQRREVAGLTVGSRRPGQPASSARPRIRKASAVSSWSSAASSSE